MSVSSTHAIGRPAWVEIDLAALVHNYRLAVLRAAPAEVWPVVKADGYGLGAVPIAAALQRAGASGFCVAVLEEAALLRDAGITVPLMVLADSLQDEERWLAELEVIAVVFGRERVAALAATATPQRPQQVMVKVDTGMGRLGCAPEELPGLLGYLAEFPSLRVVGIASHLACADQPERPVTAGQIDRFARVLDRVGAARLGYRASLANSAGILAHPGARFDLVRPGILLYGASPFHPASSGREVGLRPVVSWRTRVIQVREIAAGTPLGYGHTYMTTTTARIAQLPVGYADGYCRRLGGVARVVVNGRLAPVVGRVCMDLIAVDVTGIPGVELGTTVTLLGSDGAAEITAEELATWLGSIPYELFCLLGARLPRCYRE